MKVQDPAPLKTFPVLNWHSVQLPIGLRVAVVRESASHLDLVLPETGEKGMSLTFVQFKGELLVRPVTRQDLPAYPASPGMGLLSVSARPLEFKSAGPIQLSALSISIPEPWIKLFLGDKEQIRKMEELLGPDENIIASRLGRRQLSLFTSALADAQGGKTDLLRLQNSVMGLLEFFLCYRHRSLLGTATSSDIENEDDLILIREVESYISEYYCSDTFTVDSILKKTYTSYHRLNFLFKSIHGMTISEYIRNKRIEKSREMIADNVKSISQIAYEIGYSSISNYILAFKKVYQITPGKYKKQIGA
ncbi:MAG TPA: AraC family transcriptional regulator [Puia sp.]|nr:AraC family transcriptional regulator [Puia sp.]